MTHIWRSVYYLLGWEYPEKDLWDKKQRRLKYELNLQILKSKFIKLKKSNIYPNQDDIGFIQDNKRKYKIKKKYRRR